LLSTRLLLLSTLGLGLTAWSGSAAADQAAEPAQPAIELLHPGALPHAPVQVALPTLGDRFELVVVTHRRWSLAKGDAKAPLEAEIPVEVRLAGHVVAVDDATGTWTEELVVRTAGVLDAGRFPAEQTAASEARLRDVVGVRLVRELDRHGGHRPVGWTDARGQPTQRLHVLDSLGTVQCPLPDKPIGIGARWQVDDVVALPPVAGTAVHARRSRTFQLVDGAAGSVHCVQLMEQHSGDVLTEDGSGRISLTGKGAGRLATATTGSLRRSGVHTLHLLANTERLSDGGTMRLEQVIDVTVEREPTPREED